ncbi:MAG: SET domain-containing protein [Proteobacteria bacterium]|nr:MAG: SET domain-containing protein [Pseudomonadota bacterium]
MNRKTLDSNNQLRKFLYVDRSSIHGRGLFAREPLSRGAYLGTYDGPRVRSNGMHVLWVEDNPGKWIGRDGKNMLRYLNHSARPNVEFDGFDLYALRKIAIGEELVFDYGEDPA